MQSEKTRTALNSLRDHIDFNVPASVPGKGEQDVLARLQTEADAHFKAVAGSGGSVWQEPAAKEDAQNLAQQVIGELRTSYQCHRDDHGEGGFELCSEQIREQEHEQQQEQDEEQENEQLVELEEEQDKEVEAAIDRKYMRDGEEAKPWNLRTLLSAPNGKDSEFYPLSELTVNKGVMGQACNPLKGIPDFLLTSENYYRRSWRLSSVRRLKNVVCFLEWVPMVDKLKRLRAAGALSSDQRGRLKEAFEMCDKERSGSIQAQEVRMLFRALDLDMEGESIAKSLEGKKLSLEQIERDMAAQSFFKMQQGRYYVMLSLEEAEHLRASMHLLTPKNWPSACGFAIRCITNKDACLNDSLIDSYGPVLESAELGYQLDVAEQMFRFANGMGDFQARELNILLRSLQLTKIDDRLHWWHDVRSCRRRAQKPWQQLPIAKVFVNADEFDDLPTRALLSQLRWALATKRLWPVDAFRLLDTNATGHLKRPELLAGLEWLGLHRPGVNPTLWSQHVDALFRYMDKDENSIIDLEEFRVAVELDSFDWDSMATVAARQQEKENTKQKRADQQLQLQAQSAGPQAPLHQTPTGPQAKAPLPVSQQLANEKTPVGSVSSSRLSPDMCAKLASGRFKIKWQKHSSFRSVWTTSDKSSKNSTSVWSPKDLVPTGRLKGLKKGSNAVKQRLVLGHCVGSGKKAPSGMSLIEVTDVKMGGVFTKHEKEPMRQFLSIFFPHPARYRHVCRHGTNPPLHVWEPIPPASEYVALGMVVTLEDVEPHPSEVHCVPRPWAQRFEGTPIKLWAEEGVTPAATSAWWAPVDSATPFWVTTGTMACPDINIMAPPAKFYAGFTPSV